MVVVVLEHPTPLREESAMESRAISLKSETFLSLRQGKEWDGQRVRTPAVCVVKGGRMVVVGMFMRRMVGMVTNGRVV